MQPTSPEELLERLAPLAKSGTLGLLFDYDGTLTEIAPRPEDAHLSASLRQRLLVLAAIPQVRVGIITGRSLEGLLAVSGALPGLDLAANGGLRVSGPEGDWVHPEAAARAPDLARIVRELQPICDAIPGAQLEDKQLSFSIHYRRAAPGSDVPLRKAAEKALSHVPGFRLLGGKAILEVLPDLAWDKGRALDVICDRWKIRDSAAFFGDDLIDEPAFDAVRRRGGFAVRVGTTEHPTHATCVLPSIVAVHRLLDLLLDELA